MNEKRESTYLVEWEIEDSGEFEIVATSLDDARRMARQCIADGEIDVEYLNIKIEVTKTGDLP